MSNPNNKLRKQNEKDYKKTLSHMTKKEVAERKAAEQTEKLRNILNLDPEDKPEAPPSDRPRNNPQVFIPRTYEHDVRDYPKSFNATEPSPPWLIIVRGPDLSDRHVYAKLAYPHLPIFGPSVTPTGIGREDEINHDYLKVCRQQSLKAMQGCLRYGNSAVWIDTLPREDDVNHLSRWASVMGYNCLVVSMRENVEEPHSNTIIARYQKRQLETWEHYAGEKYGLTRWSAPDGMYSEGHATEVVRTDYPKAMTLYRRKDVNFVRHNQECWELLPTANKKQE